MFLVAKWFTNSSDRKIIVGDSRISFGWQLKSDKNNTVQKAYRISVMNDKKEVVWDTGRIESRKECCWKANVWNNHGEVA